MAKKKRPVVRRGRKPGTGRPRSRTTVERRGGTGKSRSEQLARRVPASVRREVASYYSDVTDLPRLYNQYSPFASKPPKSMRGVAKAAPNVTSRGGFRTRRMR